MNVIVNGASGYIGFYVVSRLLECGHTVFAVCGESDGQLHAIDDQSNLTILNRYNKNFKEKLYEIKCDIWYQLAWEGACGSKRSDPEIQVKNELMCIDSVKAAKDAGCKKIIFAGTVYENFASSMIENELFNTNSFYIISKKHTREITYQFSKKLGIDYIWVQFCHPIGLYMNENQMIPYAIKSFVSNEENSFGNCTQYFDIISVRDLADAFIILGERDNKKNFYYIGSNKPRILRNYLEETAEICGYKREIGFGRRPDDGLIFDLKWFDTSDFINEFCWKPEISFSASIIELSDYYRGKQYEYK